MEISRSDAEAIASQIDGEVREDYSGRAMYGRECVGFTGDFTEFSLAVAMSRVLDECDVEELSNEVRSDSMGRDVIVYFPYLTIAEDS